MADDLLDLYLGSGEAKKPTSLLDTYLPPATASVSPASELIPAGAPVNGKQEYITQDEYNKRIEATKKLTEQNSIGNRIIKGATDLPVDLGKNISENYNAGIHNVGEGLTDIGNNNSAIGVGKVGLGLLSAVASPLTGAIQTAVTDPVTQLTGNPDIGDKAGFVAGSGLPIGGATKAAVSQIPKVKALDNLIDAIGPENLSTVVQRLKDNPRLSVMDVSPAVQQMGQKLVTTEGPHQNKFAAAVDERTAGAKNAVKDAYDESMGAPVNVIQKLNDMKIKAQETGRNVINPIVENSNPADITSVINNIDDMIVKGGPVERKTLQALKNGETPSLPLSDAQNKLFQIREQLRGDWQDRPDMFLDIKGEQGAHNIQSGLRAEAQSLMDSQDPKDRLVGRKMMNIRNQLVDAIDSAAPGYKDALGKYADDKQVQEAFDYGRNILRNRPTVDEDRPEFLQQYLANAKPEQVDALRQGARVAVDNQIRGMRNAVGRKGVEIPDVEFNSAKLKQIFGNAEVNKTFKTLQDERDIADTNNKLLEGSQTAMRMKSNSKVDLPTEKGINPLGYATGAIGELAGSATGHSGIGLSLMAGNAAHDLAFLGKRKLAKMKNSNLSDLMTATGEARQNLIDALERRIPNPQLSIGQKIKTALPVVFQP